MLGTGFSLVSIFNIHNFKSITYDLFICVMPLIGDRFTRKGGHTYNRPKLKSSLNSELIVEIRCKRL